MVLVTGQVHLELDQRLGLKEGLYPLETMVGAGVRV